MEILRNSILIFYFSLCELEILIDLKVFTALQFGILRLHLLSFFFIYINLGFRNDMANSFYCSEVLLCSENIPWRCPWEFIEQDRVSVSFLAAFCSICLWTHQTWLSTLSYLKYRFPVTSLSRNTLVLASSRTLMALFWESWRWKTNVYFSAF